MTATCCRDGTKVTPARVRPARHRPHTAGDCPGGGADQPAVGPVRAPHGTPTQPAAPAGGFKLWEGAIDLCQFLCSQYELTAELLQAAQGPLLVSGGGAWAVWERGTRHRRRGRQGWLVATARAAARGGGMHHQWGVMVGSGMHYQWQVMGGGPAGTTSGE